MSQAQNPKIVHHCDPMSLLINTFGIRLESGYKSHEQIIYYRTAKSVHPPKKKQKKTSDSFYSIFRRIL